MIRLDLRPLVQGLAFAAMTALAACGGDDSPTGPSGSGGGSGPGPSGATITIANGRVTPANVTISVGQSVTFVNSDGRPHNIASDPHPAHNDCPAVNSVGLLPSGQTRQTSALTTARVCGFHDHDDPDNGNLRGQIDVR